MREINRVIVLLLLILAMAAGCSKEDGAQTSETGHRGTDSGGASPARGTEADKLYPVKRVVDGDSIVLDGGAEVRYIGINCPELRQPLAFKAAAMNKSLVEGKEVILEFQETRTDRYGRLLAYVFVPSEESGGGRKFVNEELIKEGLGWVLLFSGSETYGAALIGAQRKAIEEKKGIWSEPAEETAEYYVGSKTGYRFHRPDCKFGKKISKGNLIRYESRIDAFMDGRSPCDECKP